MDEGWWSGGDDGNYAKIDLFLDLLDETPFSFTHNLQAQVSAPATAMTLPLPLVGSLLDEPGFEALMQMIQGADYELLQSDELLQRQNATDDAAKSWGARVFSTGREAPPATQHRPPLEFCTRQPLRDINDFAVACNPPTPFSLHPALEDCQLSAHGSSPLSPSLTTIRRDCEHGVGMDVVKGSPLVSRHEPRAHHVSSADCDLDFTFPDTPIPHADMSLGTFGAPAHAELAPAFSMPFEPASAATALDMDPQSHVFLDSAAPIVPDYPMEDFSRQIPLNQAEQRLSAFARLRFNDGSYYMHTYQIILGRNVELAHKDMRRLAKAEALRKQGDMTGASVLLHGKKRKRPQRNPRSVISETGGIVNAPMASMPPEYQQRRQSLSHSASSSSHHHHHHTESTQEGPVDQAPQHLLMQAFQEVPEQLDSYVPEDPGDCPLVPIHPQNIVAHSGVRGPKGISREHAKIYYDFDQGEFCLKVLSSNGLWHEDKFYQGNEVIELAHGDTICIGLVEMSFFLPDVALTKEQKASHEDSASRGMSLVFENGNGEIESIDQMSDDSASEDASVNPRHVYHYPEDYDSDEDAIGEDDDELDDEDDPATPEHRPRQSLKLKLKSKARISSRKDAFKAPKRKVVREPSPEEPVAKRQKQRVKEMRKEPPHSKDKGKAPAKAPTKAPTKAATKAPAKEPVKATPLKDKVTPAPAPLAVAAPPPVKSTVPESPTVPTVVLRKPIEGGSPDDVDQEGFITADMVKKHNLPEVLIGYTMAKRKGPGRPPKDGVMSKRQRSQLVKQGKEIEKARAAGIDPADIPVPTVKPKIARPRKDSNAHAAEGEDDDVRETTETRDTLANLGDKKQAKPNKPTRTPSPEMKQEDYTEEQLQRPMANYVVLIHEAISSSATQQMNLQQIYNFIERRHPYYKFRTTTSGWQSSVRHNLGQHEAFQRGEKEGKGFNWKINPEVSIEKERRKRQVTPPQPQRQGYYPPPNGAYPPSYGQPGPPPFYPGMPPGAPTGPSRPPDEPIRRLPPSLRNTISEQAATPAPNTARPNPYASPWAGGNAAGSPPSQKPSPYPLSNSQPPIMSPAPVPSSMYGMMVPTSAPQALYGSYTTASTFGGQYATAGASPYAGAPSRPSPYAPAGSPSTVPPAPAAPTYPPPSQRPANQPRTSQDSSSVPHSSGRYPPSTNPYVISQLEAFRGVYLAQRREPGEDAKVDNAIQAFVNSERLPTLTTPERALLSSIQEISTLRSLEGDGRPEVKQEGNGDMQANDPSYGNSDAANSTPPVSAATTAAAIAASDAAVVAASTIQTDVSTPFETKRGSPKVEVHETTTAPVSGSTPSISTEPHKFMPNMMGSTNSPPLPNPIPSAAAITQAIRAQIQRPSVEPLTPVPGSPAVHNGTPVIRSTADASEDAEAGAK